MVSFYVSSESLSIRGLKVLNNWPSGILVAAWPALAVLAGSGMAWRIGGEGKGG